MNHSKKETLVLCDFDGTASSIDVGYQLLRYFSRDEWENIDRKYRTDRMGSMEAYGLIAAAIHSSEEDFLAYLPQLTRLDPGFVEFKNYCHGRDFDMKIVSDGLDFYIKNILAHYGIDDIPFYSNRLIFNNGSGIRIDFPLQNPDCRKCGTCKKKLLEQFRDDYKTIIYIGDGYSDRCAAESADFVFAKRFLYQHCQEKGIPCTLYAGFEEILNHLRNKEGNIQTK